MMMKLAGGPGAANPLDFNARKRPVPRWMWIAAGASLLVHGAAGVWLYQQKFEMQAPAATPEPRPTIVELIPRPRPPEPQVAQATPPPTPIHRAAPSPVTPPVTIPLTPPDTTIIGDFSPLVIPASPAPADGQAAEPAPAADTGPPVITHPRWIARPTPDQMMRAYPMRAQRDGVEGSATLRCAVTARGGLTDCAVLSESPGGYGFGRAAMQLSRHFRLSPRTVDGQAVEGALVTIPLTFQLN